MTKVTLTMCVTAALCMATRQAHPTTPTMAEITSPDGRIAVAVSDADGLHYRVTMDGKPVLADSRLGMEFEGQRHIGPHARIVNSTRGQHDATWENHFGKQRIVRDRYRELRVQLAEDDKTPLEFALLVRVYDDGVALRYDLPRQAGLDHFVVTDERTEFVFPKDYRCWGGDFSDCVENLYPERHVSQIGSPSVLPLLVELPQGYVAIAEADLIDWGGMFLAAVKQPAAVSDHRTTVKVSLAHRRDGHGLVVSATPRVSPWRVLDVGAQGGDLLLSDLIVNLATPSQIADISLDQARHHGVGPLVGRQRGDWGRRKPSAPTSTWPRPWAGRINSSTGVGTRAAT